MDDPERVRLRDRLARLQHPSDGDVDRERTASRKLLREIASREELHHHVRRAVGEAPDVRDASDVLALDAHRRLRLAQEASHQIRVRRGRRKQEFERHFLAELEVRGGDHHAHSAGAEDAFYAVLAEQHVARRDRRGRARTRSVDHPRSFSRPRMRDTPFSRERQNARAK
jgi:hypothetical protein